MADIIKTIEAKQEKISKMQEKMEKIKKELGREQSALKTVARKADTRLKIEDGGLLRIAYEVEGFTVEDKNLLLGALMSAVRAIKTNHKPETLAHWKSVGLAELSKRAAAQQAKKNANKKKVATVPAG